MFGWKIQKLGKQYYQATAGLRKAVFYRPIAQGGNPDDVFVVVINYSGDEL